MCEWLLLDLVVEPFYRQQGADRARQRKEKGKRKRVRQLEGEGEREWLDALAVETDARVTAAEEERNAVDKENSTLRKRVRVTEARCEWLEAENERLFGVLKEQTDYFIRRVDSNYVGQY